MAGTAAADRRQARDAGRRRLPRWPALGESFARDLEGGRGFLWWPVAFGGGAATYFALLDEPSLPVFLVCAGLAAVAVAAARFGRLHAFVATLAALAAAGFLHAALMTRLAAHPVFAFERTVTVRGLVEAVEDREKKGMRLVVRPVEIEPEPRGGLPPRIRVTTRGLAEPPRPGAGLVFRARLAPPASPALPGGYDFARVAWFSGEGAAGFALGRPQVWDGAPPPTGDLPARAAVAALRLDVAGRIRAQLPGDAGGIAAALVVGDRGGIGAGAADAMRTAGLSHILSISGLHMSLVAAGLFAALRLVFALIAPLALDWPAKKIAAVLALAGTLGYFVISGMDVPAARSTIMVAVMLLAVLVDRRALSMRVIAVAALLTLALSPQAVMDPGAQMSFAAVLALLAGLEAWSARRREVADGGDVSPLVRLAGRVARWLGAALATTFIAGLATAPIALYHFGRLSPLGMAANLLSAPLVSFVIMPGAMVSAFAMPFGLDRLPLAVMGFGIDRMLDVARLVAGWTPGGGLVGRPDATAVLLIVVGGLWICLWTSAKRWFGMVAVVVGLAGVVLSEPPALAISDDGRLVFVRDGDRPRLVGRGDGFTTAVFLSAMGIDAGDGARLTRTGSRCDGEACLLTSGGGAPLVAVVTAPPAFADECRETPVVVSPLPAPPWCRPPGLLVDGAALSASGARLYRRTGEADGSGFAAGLVETARVFGTRRRPWQPAGGG